MSSRKSARFILPLLILLLICIDNFGPRTRNTSSSVPGMRNENRLLAFSSAASARRVFTWRNFFRSSPDVEQQSDAPLVIRNPRFYSHWTWGYGIGATLDYDVVNVSRKPIHSFFESRRSGEPWGSSGGGSQPESALKPGDSMVRKTSVGGKSRVTLTVEFVQFADGTTWYSNDGQKFVWGFGHYCGVTNVVVKVQHANREGGLRTIEGALRRILDDPAESDR